MRKFEFVAKAQFLSYELMLVLLVYVKFVKLERITDLLLLEHFSPCKFDWKPFMKFARTLKLEIYRNSLLVQMGNFRRERFFEETTTVFSIKK